jgi:hypothetical protein
LLAAVEGVRRWTARPVRCRAESARVADSTELARVTADAEPAGVANRPELLGITDHGERISPGLGKPSRIAGPAELVRIAAARRRVELVAGNVSVCLRPAGGRKLGTPNRGTLSVP